MLVIRKSLPGFCLLRRLKPSWLCRYTQAGEEGSEPELKVLQDGDIGVLSCALCLHAERGSCLRADTL